MTRDNTGGGPTDEAPALAFAAVGNEIRIEILWTLYESSVHPPNELSFSELHSQITADIASSQLTYHLQQLIGHFVKKTGGGYRLSPVGRRLCRVLRTGIFHRNKGQVSVDAGFNCHYCQAPVEATFNEHSANVQCPDCEYIYVGGWQELPLEMFEDALAAYIQFKKYQHHKTLVFARGLCWACGNSVGAEFCTPDEVPLKIAQPQNKVGIDRSCNHCGTLYYLTVGTALLADPGLVYFCHEHGIDVLSPSFWELKFAGTDKYVTVRSTDPWEVALRVTYGGDTLELVVDGDLDVVERNRLGFSKDVSASLLRGVQMGLPDKEACLESLRRCRWPNGITCPHCDSADTIKKGTTSKGAQRYKCHTCNSSFNDLTGTIFAEHRLSLSEMFHIIREMDEVQTTQIARQLDRSYKSVLDFVHEVQDARDRKLEFELSDICDADNLPVTTCDLT